jgi:hypothetical protein
VTVVDTHRVEPKMDEAQLLFQEARRRRRRRRLLAVTVVVLLTTGAVLVTVMSTAGGGHVSSPATSSISISRFVPPTSTKGSVTTMLVRLPDGRGFSLTYPHSLGLSKFSQTAGGQVDWPVSTGPLTCCDEYSAPDYGSLSSIFEGKPIAVYKGAHGQAVPYYAGSQERYPFLYPTTMNYLAFSFGPWVVLVEDVAHSSYYTARMTAQERTTWARSFDARIAKGGYLVFQPRAPLRVQRGSIDITMTGSNGSLELSGPTVCGTSQLSPTVNAGVTGWCEPRAEVRVAATGTSTFVESAASGLRIAALRPVS